MGVYYGRVAVVNSVTGGTVTTLITTGYENQYGRAVCGIGDFDNDGRGDFAVGVPREDTPTASATNMTDGGRVFIYRAAVWGTTTLQTAGSTAALSTLWLQYFGTPSTPSLVLADVSAGPTPIPPYGSLSLGMTASLAVMNDSAGIFGAPFGAAVDTQGMLVLGPWTVQAGWAGVTLYLQAFGITASAPNGVFQMSNGLTVTF